jgi:hypothetical protein
MAYAKPKSQGTVMAIRSIDGAFAVYIIREQPDSWAGTIVILL